MTTPWKSQGRKYCEFCDCWFADNKVSISFHENGKRHKESVEKKVKEIQRKGSEKEKKEKDEKTFLEMMEKGAAAAIEKDIKSDPRMITHYFGDDVEVPLPDRSDDPPVQGPALPPPAKKMRQTPDEQSSSSSSQQPQGRLWYEALSPEGYVYYWNTVTNESVWVAPPQGYVPLSEQTGDSSTTSSSSSTSAQPVKSETKLESKCEIKTENKREAEVKPKLEIKEEKKVGAGVVQRKSWKERAYGDWNAVKPEPQSGEDLQLPQSTVEANLERDRATAATASINVKDEVHFATKVVPSITPSAGTTKTSAIVFKKRKINAGANTRIKEERGGS